MGKNGMLGRFRDKDVERYTLYTGRRKSWMGGNSVEEQLKIMLR